ncbi:MAG TPA: DNA-3-methyladenine glycosylase I [Candidatus Eremiobacteraceae bacterium]|jgi:DNA-3-methyladenine glycosylase I|nr:DNA-3-methyladenine glycosylase I [Candidatus Eremiobacteraceae bacterium]
MPKITSAEPAAKTRCRWATREPSLSYHDEEWGVPVHDDRTWFEFITLEGAQAGLSWETILKKRDRYRKVFSNFDPKKVARYDAKKKKSLLADAGIIRNRLKIDSTITNAQAFLKIQKEFGSFDKYIWQFVEGKPLQSNLDPTSKMIVSTEVSDAISKDLKKRGFRFVGTTIIYALMQATGLVNDHTSDCYRFASLSKNTK